MMRARAALLLLLLAGPALAQAPRPAPTPAPTPAPAPAGPEKAMGLRMESTVTLRGPGGRWGTPVVDELNRRLYLPRGPAGLGVLSLDGFKPVAEIADTAGSGAVALDPETLRGFSANALETRPGGPAGSGITVFDQRSLKPIGSIPFAASRIVYDAATKQVVASREGELALIDPAKLTITVTLPLDGKLAMALATDRRGRAFVALADRDAIAVVDLVARRVATAWKPEGCRMPVSLAYDTFGQRLIALCRGAAAQQGGAAAAPAGLLIDPYTGKSVGNFFVPPAPDQVVHDPVNRMLYFLSAATSVALAYRQADPYRYEPLESASTRPLAGQGVADPRGGRLIVTSAEYIAVPGPDGGVPRILNNSFTLLVMRRLPVE